MEQETIADRKELEAEVGRLDALIEVLFHESPDGISILAKDGTARTNQAGNVIFGPGASSEHKLGDWSTTWGFFTPDGSAPVPLEELAGMRALRGETVESQLLFLRGPGLPRGVMLSAAARPTPSGAIVVMRDVSERVALEVDLTTRARELAAREQENRELITRLRVALDDLSTPVLELAEDVLALPVIGLVDSQRSAQISERLLNEVVRSRARFVIIDLTGVELVDTATADRLGKLAHGVRLLGAVCVVSGLQPQVARTVVELGVDLGAVEMKASLRTALEHCLARRAATKRGA